MNSKRRHHRSKYITKRLKTAKWYGREYGRLSLHSPYNCSKPKCIHCYRKKLFKKEQINLRDKYIGDYDIKERKRWK